MASRVFAAISPARWRLILHLLGLAVLLASYSGAALVWRAQTHLDESNASLAANDAAPLSPLDSRTSTRQLDLQYGKMGLLMEGVTEWVESLTHGKGLAKSMIVISSAAAIGCFIAAGRRTI